MKTKTLPHQFVSKSVLAACSKFSVLPKRRLLALGREALSVGHLSGDIAELGCYLGGSAMLLARLLPEKTVHAFDSLSGLRNLGPQDRIRLHQGERGHAEGDFALQDATERRRVRARLRQQGIRLHVGQFRDSKQTVAAKHFCFGHFDGDTYRSALEFITFFLPRLTIGGKLMFDDFQWPATPGVARALDDFGSRPGLRLFRPTTHQFVMEKLLS